MRVSFVLRVDPDQLPSGRLVGEIEEVLSGQTGGVQGPSDVLAFCRNSVSQTNGSIQEGEADGE
ncbi:hypothetical protein K6U06_02930 [Acidiferrimicrobium sp. IK]|uniref:hypothetical protein n=1 Tax=Acidiferrimicrobium sp. IK TaxID=2871700 RepID=UPI0021CB3985|nr:hypothetical protein [Acidiferrimicrobium sp. IK]MCU4183299.1 hypothetical protein [Acidiferrimicrobium sp. IK]